MRIGMRPKVIGLAALTITAIAVGTGGITSAETGACWGYKSGASLPCFSTSLEPRPVIAIESFATLLMTGLNLEIKCPNVAVIEGGTLTANGSILLGRLEFSNCTAWTMTPSLTLVPACTPNDPVAGLGRIRSEKGTGLIVLHNGEPVLELKPDSGTLLARIYLGEECFDAEEILITGKLILQDAGGKAAFETHALTHLIREFPGLQLMRRGGLLATIDGTSNVTLASPHNALEWAGKAA